MFLDELEELFEPSIQEILLTRLGISPLSLLELVPLANANGYSQAELLEILTEMVEEGMIGFDGLKYHPVEITEELDNDKVVSRLGELPLAGD